MHDEKLPFDTEKVQEMLANAQLYDYELHLHESSTQSEQQPCTWKSLSPWSDC